MSQATVLILDDNDQVCKFLQAALASWGLAAEVLGEPQQVLEFIGLRNYDLLLLDVVLPGMNGLDFLPSIHEACPELKVIIMTGYADKAMAIDALRAGAFDFLEKPIDLTLLQHTVKRAIEAQGMVRAHRQTLNELQRSKEELQAYATHLEQLNGELHETYHALLVLARSAERARQDTEERIITHLRSLVLPLIEDMRQDERLLPYESNLTVLVNAIQEAVAGLVTHLGVVPALSTREMRIALMIKNGLTSEAIAAYLRISPETVKTHRRNIRKKLGLIGSGDQLRAYFRSLGADDSLSS
jgi:FixJ family two-component response regulator